MLWSLLYKIPQIVHSLQESNLFFVSLEKIVQYIKEVGHRPMIISENVTGIAETKGESKVRFFPLNENFLLCHN